MSAPAADRRGDRRTEAWRCQGTIPVVGGGVAATAPCGAGEELRQELEHNGTVYCTRCGTVDRRSTEGNRRRAAAELRELERRVERELHGIAGRLEELEERTTPAVRHKYDAGGES